MNPRHSPRNEHSKLAFGKKNSEEKFGESETLCKVSDSTISRLLKIIGLFCKRAL